MITLTITVDDNEFASLLANALASNQSGAVSVPPPDTAPPDPWATSEQEQTWPQTTPQATQTAPQAQPATRAPAPQASIPACAHGPMKFVPGGFSKKSGKPYGAFWACGAPRGQEQCKGQDA